MHTLSPSSWTSLPSPPHHPSRLSQSPGLSCLHQTAHSHWLPGWHVVTHVPPRCSLSSSHPLLPQLPLFNPLFNPLMTILFNSVILILATLLKTFLKLFRFPAVCAVSKLPSPLSRRYCTSTNCPRIKGTSQIPVWKKQSRKCLPATTWKGRRKWRGPWRCRWAPTSSAPLSTVLLRAVLCEATGVPPPREPGRPQPHSHGSDPKCPVPLWSGVFSVLGCKE